MTEQEAREIYRQGEEAVVAKLMEFDKRLKRLEEIINTNSSNSSKPPSSDNKLKKTKTTTKKKSLMKKRGGQKGRVGKTLKMVENPDEVVTLKSTTCNCCNKDISNEGIINISKRQLFDVLPIKIKIIEYQSYHIKCPHCKTINKPKFPNNITNHVQYGNNLKSLVAYLNTYHMLPYERISELIEDITSSTCKISSGTIYNMLNSTHNNLENFEISLKDKLLNQNLLHADETGVNIGGNINWIHTITNKKLTFYHLNKKRGNDAIKDINILPNYQNILIHDFWQPYNKYENITHAYCNAHIIRELQAEIDNNKYKWAKDLQKLLKNINKHIKKQREKGILSLTDSKIQKYSNYYDKITQNALKYYDDPPDNIPKKKKGKKKQEKGKNLLDRLIKYKDGILLFMYNFSVPFTNNLAERDLRMIKVKQKISGCFTSFKGGEIFCRIKGYISTLKKNQKNVLEWLKKTYNCEVSVSMVVGG